MRKLINLLGVASLSFLATASVFAQASNDATFSFASFPYEAKDPTGIEQMANSGQTVCADPKACTSDMTGKARDPLIGLDVFGGLDTLHGVSQADWPNYFGAVSGANAGVLLPGSLGEHGFGWQLGTSLGAYDLAGRMTSTNTMSTEEQIFATTGFFRKTQCDRGWSYGIVYDWMLNSNWGVDAFPATMSQWRAQMEYSLSRCDSIGVYGTLRDMTYTNVPTGIIDRSINQVDLFWDHKFERGTDVRVWLGLPEQDRLPGGLYPSAQLGSVILGAETEVPVSDRISLYASFEYMVPAVSAGPTAAYVETYDVSIGFVWHPGRCTCGSASASAPYMTLGNNRNFLVDQSR